MKSISALVFGTILMSAGISLAAGPMSMKQNFKIKIFSSPLETPPVDPNEAPILRQAIAKYEVTKFIKTIQPDGKFEFHTEVVCGGEVPVTVYGHGNANLHGPTIVCNSTFSSVPVNLDMFMYISEENSEIFSVKKVRKSVSAGGYINGGASMPADFNSVIESSYATVDSSVHEILVSAHSERSISCSNNNCAEKWNEDFLFVVEFHD